MSEVGAPEADGAPLFLLDEVPAGDVLTVDGAEGRHAVDVLRLAAGERVRVSDGRGLLVEGAVLAASASTLQVQVLARHDVPPPEPVFVLVQALPKGDHGPLAVDLATELGVDRIVPWTAARCVTKWREDRVDKGLAKWRGAGPAGPRQAPPPPARRGGHHAAPPSRGPGGDGADEHPPGVRDARRRRPGAGAARAGPAAVRQGG